MFDHLVRCETRLYNGADALLRREHGLVTSQLEFLRYLRDRPTARAADVAEFFAVGVGATSKGMSRLEARGWIVRTPNPEDGRSALIALTPAGRKIVKLAEPTLDRYLEAVLGAAIDSTEMATLEALLAKLRGSLTAAGIGIPAG